MVKVSKRKSERTMRSYRHSIQDTDSTAKAPDPDFNEVIDRCKAEARKLQSILDTKQELERENLKQYDPDFFNQLTERLSLKKLEEHTKKLLSV
jgi:hypothetical protein